MAKVIVTAIGSAGDVHPLLGVARALALRGHDVVFCTHPPFAAAARRCGFTFVPVGTAAEYEAAMANPALWDPRTSFRTLWQVIAPVLRPHYDTLRTLTDRDTVLVGTLWAFSARFMQELHGTPYVSVQVSPSTLLSAHVPPTHPRLTIPARWPLPVKAALMTLIERQVLDRVCGPALNAVRRDLGLAPARRVLGRWLHSTDGVLCLFPDWFAPAQRDWPAGVLQSGFPLFNDIATPDDDRALDAFLAAGEPPVVFTAGSTRVDHAAYARTVAGALHATGARGILLSPHDVAPGGDRLLVRRFVPMRTLLPRCRALVHHGGIGTAALAFEAGIPQVVTPFAHDQFDNAQRVAASGAGVRVDGAVDGVRLGAALARVLDEPEFSVHAERTRALIHAAPDGCETAADYIERFAPNHERAISRPVVAMAGT
ncbi:glycosyl transferase family 1 [Burkholderia sp. MSMB0856]|uniref:glycosyltransferase n=1 Tax=Burkholderia sp. MSMB0856 TaxID=1637869 RepID=UPI000757625D|nr:nucleotide disphospho-sugar-binding domain-containing protein [Burkholderia sp. MSMB0856]AOJ89974.1 glycosyl transferase family 1 [Burkholderia sp. MSMB0856]KVH34838.1 glycosyl transferase family 1 [Burkholderia sp. MSMB0856]